MSSSSSSSSFSLLSALLILSLLPLLSSAGRPCKTLFISYYTTTITTSAATSSLSDRHAGPTSRFYAVYRISPLDRRPAHHLHRRPLPVSRPVVPSDDRLGLRLGFGGVTSSSLQDRAKDILIVVAGLLFGLGCGAVTASTMYLLWSLLSDHRRIGSDEGDDGGEYSDVESPKKMGYVKIAASDVDPVKAATKEGYEGK